MPKMKLLTSMAGINFSHNAGDIIDCNEAEAMRFVEAGIAEPVEERETATRKPKKRKAVKE